MGRCESLAIHSLLQIHKGPRRSTGAWVETNGEKSYAEATELVTYPLNQVKVKGLCQQGWSPCRLFFLFYIHRGVILQCELIRNHIQNWLSKKLEESRLSGYAVGLSGGIDSALVSALCARSTYPTHLIIMPIHQNPEHTQRALDHIEWLKSYLPGKRDLTYDTIDLTETFETFRKTQDLSVADHKLSMANTRARLRMTQLYAYAGAHNRLVIGTGNKIEDYGVGFFLSGVMEA